MGSTDVERREHSRLDLPEVLADGRLGGRRYRWRGKFDVMVVE